MSNPQIQNDPVYNLGLLYINGLVVSNDPNLPNTRLNISSGMCRDSNNIMDITLGNSNPNLEGAVEAAPLILDANRVGVNGIDTGALIANTLYSVYAIADSRYYLPTASILTLATNAVPSVPMGYDSLRLIGFAATDGSSHFMKKFTSGSGSFRKDTYDGPFIVSTGSSTSAANFSLAAFVPAVNNISVELQCVYTPAVAGNIAQVSGANQANWQITIYGQVATKIIQEYEVCNAQLVSGVPTMKYQVTVSDNLAVFVTGFWYSL